MQVAHNASNPPAIGQNNQEKKSENYIKLGTIFSAIFTGVKFIVTQTAPKMDSQVSSGISFGGTAGLFLAYFGCTKLIERRKKRKADLEARSLLNVSVPSTPAFPMPGSPNIGRDSAAIISNSLNEIDSSNNSPFLTARSKEKTENSNKIVIGHPSIRRPSLAVDNTDAELDVIPKKKLTNINEEVKESTKETMKEPVKTLSPKTSPATLTDSPTKPPESRKSASLGKISLTINPVSSVTSIPTETPPPIPPPVVTPRSAATTPKSTVPSPVISKELENISFASDFKGINVGGLMSFNQDASLTSEATLDDDLVPSPRTRDDTPAPSPRGKQTSLLSKTGS